MKLSKTFQLSFYSDLRTTKTVSQVKDEPVTTVQVEFRIETSHGGEIVVRADSEGEWCTETVMYQDEIPSMALNHVCAEMCSVAEDVFVTDELFVSKGRNYTTEDGIFYHSLANYLLYGNLTIGSGFPFDPEHHKHISENSENLSSFCCHEKRGVWVRDVMDGCGPCKISKEEIELLFKPWGLQIDEVL